MKFAELAAQADALQNIVKQELGIELTGDETVKIEVPFKKTIKVIHRTRLFSSEIETITEKIMVRELELDRIAFDRATNQIIIKVK